MDIKKYYKYWFVLLVLILLFLIGIIVFIQFQNHILNKLSLTISPISANGYHSAAIMEDGSLWVWGNNNFDQFSDIEITDQRNEISNLTPIWVMNDVVSVSTGSFHGVVISSEGDLWGWGKVSNGQLGIGGRIGHANSEGGWAVWPPFSPLDQINISNEWHDTKGITELVKIKRNVSHVSVGNWHSMSIRSDGTLFGWGSNYLRSSGGWLPNNSFFRLRRNLAESNNIIVYPERMKNNIVTVSTGNNHTMAIDMNGTLFGWGRNSFGEVGTLSFSTIHRGTKIMDNVLSVSAGNNHTAAIREDGSLWTWGANVYGQLGNGEETYELNYHITGDGETVYCRTAVQDNTMPTKVMEDVIRVSVGNAYTMAITKDGSLWSWGNNSHGQLGDGTTENRLTPTFIMKEVVYVSAGNDHTLAIRSDGSLWSWGNNDHGQLGDGTIEDRHSPIRIIENGLMMPN